MREPCPALEVSLGSVGGANETPFTAGAPMGLFSRTFRPKVLHDFGEITSGREGLAKFRLSLSLIDDQGVKYLRFARKAVAPGAFGVTYTFIPEDDFGTLKAAVDAACEAT